MALTESKMIELATPMPSFKLKATTGKMVDSSDLKGEAALICFICNHCPYVKHIASQLSQLGKDLQQKNIDVIAINANDTAAYPDDSFENMTREVIQRDYTFPYLFDESQTIAREFGAVCTPDFFLFGPDRKLYYRGQLDGSRPGNKVANDGNDLRQAVTELLAGRQPPTNQIPSIGCNIKWKNPQ